MIQDLPKKKLSETPISTNKLGMVVCACGPSYMGKKILFQGWLWTKTQDSTKKTKTKQKRLKSAESMAEVVDPCLESMSSNPNITRKQRKDINKLIKTFKNSGT
jgi:hypothetical protein